MLTKEQISGYLSRLNLTDDLAVLPAATKEILNALHQAHMQSIPFENLDIHLGNKINLSSAQLYSKIITNKRGGFCYELNYLFSLLLSACGFNVSLLSAQVFTDGVVGKHFDHLLLLVELSNELMIVDVGFGDSFTQPISLGKPVTKLADANYKVNIEDDQYTLQQQKSEQDWQPQYLFTLTPYLIADFYPMCKYHQTSAESSFTKKSVCSVATKAGRITISNNQLIVTTFLETVTIEKVSANVKNLSNTPVNAVKVQRIQSIILSTQHYRQLLQAHFNVMLPCKISQKVWEKLGFTASNIAKKDRL